MWSFWKCPIIYCYTAALPKLSVFNWPVWLNLTKWIDCWSAILFRCQFFIIPQSCVLSSATFSVVCRSDFQPQFKHVKCDTQHLQRGGNVSMSVLFLTAMLKKSSWCHKLFLIYIPLSLNSEHSKREEKISDWKGKKTLALICQQENVSRYPFIPLHLREGIEKKNGNFSRLLP